MGCTSSRSANVVDGNTILGTQVLQGEPWTCTLCTMLNPPGTLVCRTCGLTNAPVTGGVAGTDTAAATEARPIKTRLPTESARSKQATKILDVVECPICLQTLEHPTTLPCCGHSFCISHSSQMNQCPVCRESLPAEEDLVENTPLSDCVRVVKTLADRIDAKVKPSNNDDDAEVPIAQIIESRADISTWTCWHCTLDNSGDQIRCQACQMARPPSDVTSREITSAIECPICLKPMEDPTTLACGHSFCLGHHVKGMNCPICWKKAPRGHNTNGPVRSVELSGCIELLRKSLMDAEESENLTAVKNQEQYLETDSKVQIPEHFETILKTEPDEFIGSNFELNKMESDETSAQIDGPNSPTNGKPKAADANGEVTPVSTDDASNSSSLSESKVREFPKDEQKEPEEESHQQQNSEGFIIMKSCGHFCQWSVSSHLSDLCCKCMDPLKDTAGTKIAPWYCKACKESARLETIFADSRQRIFAEMMHSSSSRTE